MTTPEILALARAKILEQEEDIISDTTLLIYANLAYKDVIKRAFPNNSILTATVTFTSGSGALPASFGTTYGDAVDTGGTIFPEVSIADFIRQNGAPAITIEGGVMKVSPSTTASLSVKYYPTYPTLTASVHPTIDEFLHEPIVYGTIGRAFEDLQDFELSKFYEKKASDMLIDKLNALSNYEEDSLRGGVMLNGINILGTSNNGSTTQW